MSGPGIPTRANRPRWLLTGAAGMLGRDLTGVLAADPGVELTALERSDLDVRDPQAVRAAVAGHDLVLNAAGWTDVDGAESDEPAATRVNGDGVRHLAEACAEHGRPLLHLSTDYVFAGDARVPYTEDAPTAPRTAYGRSKAVGEHAVLHVLPDHGYVVRTAWLYGPHGGNFVSTMMRLERERDTVDVVDDQTGQPTWSHDLAERLVALGRAALDGSAPPGVYHGTNSGQTTWYGLARAVFTEIGADPERVQPTSSEQMKRPAPRPAYSVLGHDRWAAAGFEPMRDWQAALHEALHEARPPVTGR